jgi:hypothetical protein
LPLEAYCDALHVSQATPLLANAVFFAVPYYRVLTSACQKCALAPSAKVLDRSVRPCDSAALGSQTNKLLSWTYGLRLPLTVPATVPCICALEDLDPVCPRPSLLAWQQSEGRADAEWPKAAQGLTHDRRRALLVRKHAQRVVPRHAQQSVHNVTVRGHQPGDSMSVASKGRLCFRAFLAAKHTQH